MPCETKDWEFSQSKRIFQAGLDEVAKPNSPSVSPLLTLAGTWEQPGFLWACADWAHENLLLSLSSNRPLSSFEQGEKRNGNMKNLYTINQHPGSWNRLSLGVSCVPQTHAQRPRLLETKAPQCSLPHRFPWHKTDLQWHWLVWLGWKSGEDVYKCSQEATRSDFKADICSLTSLDLSSINTDAGDSLLLSW